MRIAHIAPAWIAIPPKNYGGTEIVISYLVEEQVAQGHDVTLIASGDSRTSAELVSFLPQSLREAGVLWQSHLKAYYHLYKAVEYVKDHDFDIIHMHLSSTQDMYLFPLLASLTTPHVMTLHSHFPFDRAGAWLGDADQLYMEWAASVPMVAISEHARDAETYALNFVGVVHHGLPMAQFRPTVKQPEDFFAWLGHFVPAKGPHLAIEAAQKAGVPLVLAGIVNNDRQVSVDYFDKMIKPHIDGQQVKYVGPVNMQQKVDLLSRARGLLNPIQWEEPFGMVMIESMAVGCPVISFNRGAASEIVAHQKNGFLVDNVDEMVHFIPRIDEIEREVTRKYIKSNFSSDRMAKSYLEVYRTIINEREKRAGETMTVALR